MVGGLRSLRSTDVVSPQASATPARIRQGTAPSALSPRTPGAASAPAGSANFEQVKELAAEINAALEQMDEQYSVSVDDATGVVVVRITDNETGEVVKQIPPQQVLDADVSVEKIVGLLINDQA